MRSLSDGDRDVLIEIERDAAGSCPVCDADEPCPDMMEAMGSITAALGHAEPACFTCGDHSIACPDCGGCPPEPTAATAQRNVARCVLEYTEVVRRHNGRGRHATYAADVDAIAGAARQLAEMVLAECPPPEPFCPPAPFELDEATGPDPIDATWEAGYQAGKAAGETERRDLEMEVARLTAGLWELRTELAAVYGRC